MALFNYLAKDQAGKQITGAVDAANETAAIALIRSKNLYVISLIKKERESLTEVVSDIRGVPSSEKVAFTRQLATMTAAGLPLPKSLEVLALQSSNQKMKKIITECLRDVEGGSPLSVSVGKFPKVFSPTYKALLRAGEASGKMQEILLRLADTMEAQQEFRSKFKAAMVYPIIVVITMIVVVIIMMVFVIPKLSAMYKSLNAELPLPTLILLGISNFTVNYWWLILFLGIGFGTGFVYFKNTDMGKDLLSRLIFKMPIIGKITKEKELTEFTQTFSLLIGSGIPIVEALQIVSEVVENTLYKVSLENAAKSVEKGYTLSKFLKTDENFPPVVSQMIAVGEETGSLDTIMEKLSHYFATETDNAVKGLSTAIEPIILVLLGGMVGLLILSIITPIYKLTSSL
ncbi:hypothetical protein A2716_00170 [candidate division WWE3 bacterium RIFCSPHIGHO2_01_FULL_40_23]|uniref:Type II secretion system protein GspF domain-containing protein n=1 Tax=candidate division WWE3 bacterium RIFCSPLOWO2_01_FULL_41_18 TaxID=1802625 RepID=A0A1F4VDU1_UNCKA|nr:MAG: hypothetical protein A2716_00170 [candidate division WWE3 bacterium RIFCSPHIGHO2_01_FULL_40_23]OGC55412.1 MAG: hypothetical protein A3A78_00440 [candidate division WWE3 bacterium RIFCSPLOWO2_01_FULL_41_18]